MATVREREREASGAAAAGQSILRRCGGLEDAHAGRIDDTICAPLCRGAESGRVLDEGLSSAPLRPRRVATTS